MKRLALATAAMGFLSTSAFSAPLLNQAGSMAGSTPITPVKVICDENGVCYRPAGRRPVARWVYGDNAFYGPYDGPRYYGDPGRRYKWSFLSPWTW